MGRRRKRGRRFSRRYALFAIYSSRRMPFPHMSYTNIRSHSGDTGIQNLVNKKCKINPLFCIVLIHFILKKFIYMISFAYTIYTNSFSSDATSFLTVSEKVQLLEQNMSMYNLVPACVFCAQFFDPDFPGGIAIPSKSDPIKKVPFLEMVKAISPMRPEKAEYSPGLSRSLGAYSCPSSSVDLSVTSHQSRPVTSHIQKQRASLILSRHGSVLTPVKITSCKNRTDVHLLPGMDTRFDIGNNIERVNSPIAMEKRNRALKAVEITNSYLKEEAEAFRQKKMKDALVD